MILPASFPYGGMENPILTFASPTILMTEDAEQLYVATHELAHNWSGNCVTQAQFKDMWLNEGFTTFEERKVTAMQRGEDYVKVSALRGLKALER